MEPQPPDRRKARRGHHPPGSSRDPLDGLRAEPRPPHHHDGHLARGLRRRGHGPHVRQGLRPHHAHRRAPRGDRRRPAGRVRHPHRQQARLRDADRPDCGRLPRRGPLPARARHGPRPPRPSASTSWAASLPSCRRAWAPRTAASSRASPRRWPPPTACAPRSTSPPRAPASTWTPCCSPPRPSSSAPAAPWTSTATARPSSWSLPTWWRTPRSWRVPSTAPARPTPSSTWASPAPASWPRPSPSCRRPRASWTWPRRSSRPPSRSRAPVSS